MSRIDELLKTIRSYEGQSKLSADQRDAIGKALDEVQTTLPRGNFGPWIAQNLWFSYGMASYYMKCYRDNVVVRKYEETTTANPFFYDPSSKPSDNQPSSMTPDDYKKLVMYMRDNAELTMRMKGMHARFEQQTRTIEAHLERIRHLQIELEDARRNAGSDPFRNLFGGGNQTLSKDEYRTLISALHPDRAMSDEQRAKFTKATQIINQKMKAN